MRESRKVFIVGFGGGGFRRLFKFVRGVWKHPPPAFRSAHDLFIKFRGFVVMTAYMYIHLIRLHDSYLSFSGAMVTSQFLKKPW